jgi:hypothetical protein
MERRLWTIQEVEILTPNERDQIIRDGMVDDVSALPPQVVARLTAAGEALIRKRGLLDSAS